MMRCSLELSLFWCLVWLRAAGRAGRGGICRSPLESDSQFSTRSSHLGDPSASCSSGHMTLGGLFKGCWVFHWGCAFGGICPVPILRMPQSFQRIGWPHPGKFKKVVILSEVRCGVVPFLCRRALCVPSDCCTSRKKGESVLNLKMLFICIILKD